MSIFSPDSREVQQRIAALMAIARDGRRTRQVREAALRELKELTAQKQRSQQRQQKHQGQQAERTVTAVSSSVPAQPRVSTMPRRIMLAPVSILDDPKPSRDVKDAIPVPDSQDDDRRQRLLAFKEHVLATDSDADKLSWVRDQLREMDEPEPFMVSEPERPAGKSDWQKNHEYWYGEAVDPAPPTITVDFAGFGIPEQGAPDRFWDKQWTRESTARTLAATRTKSAGPQVRVWRPGMEFDEL